MILTVGIDGRWTALELGAVLQSLEVLARFLETGEVEEQSPTRFRVEGSTIIQEEAPPLEGRLSLLRFEYASPGSFDLLGVAKVVEQIRLLVQYVIDFWSQRNDRELSRAERRLALLERIKESDPETAKLIEKHALDSIISAIADKRLTSVSTREK
jgi:hypothetical protein